MLIKELMEYLQMFPPDTEISMAAVNPADRVIHDTQGVVLISDSPRPMIFLEVDGGEPFTEEMREAAEEDEGREAGTDGNV